MSDGNPFTKMVPGFDFLQTLVKSAGAAIPSVGQWVAPTLDPDELNKRIEELKTVQFWLEQNARLLGTTIQAMEVQRMTLSTLRTMNVSLGDLTESLKIRVPEPAPAPAPPPPPAAPRAAAPAPEPEPAAEDDEDEGTEAAADASAQPASAGAIDPMQWWSALTQQFTALAANAMRDGSAAAMVQQGVDAAGQALKAAAAIMPAAMPSMGGAVAPPAADAAAVDAKPVRAAGKQAAAGPSNAKPAARPATRPAAKGARAPAKKARAAGAKPAPKR